MMDSLHSNSDSSDDGSSGDGSLRGREVGCGEEDGGNSSFTLLDVSLKLGESDVSSVSFNLSNPYCFLPDERGEGRRLLLPPRPATAIGSDGNEQGRSGENRTSGDNLQLGMSNTSLRLGTSNTSRDIESLIGDMSLRSIYETSSSNQEDVVQKLMGESSFNVVAESPRGVASRTSQGRQRMANHTSRRSSLDFDRSSFDRSSFALGAGKAPSEKSSSYDADRSEFLLGESDSTKSSHCGDRGEMVGAETAALRGSRLRSLKEDDRINGCSVSLKSDLRTQNAADGGPNPNEDVRRRSSAKTVRRRNGTRRGWPNGTKREGFGADGRG